MPQGIIAVGNLKGGVGKSTIAVNLACALAGKSGKPVLVDADAQGTAVEWAAGGGLPIDVVHLPIDENTDPDEWRATVQGHRETAGLVVVDLPPHWGPALTAALEVTDLLLIPVTPSGADLKATLQALERLAQTRRHRKGKPPTLLVPSRVDRRTAAGREIESVLADMGEPVGPAILQRSAHIDAFTTGRWVGDWARKSAARADIDALASHVKRSLT
ncbi:MAG: ParA family protein [Alphaproteobacteria bacterium]|nr:ParA family protein [Alphaproteobacteria bacterium]